MIAEEKKTPKGAKYRNKIIAQKKESYKGGRQE